MISPLAVSCTVPRATGAPSDSTRPSRVAPASSRTFTSPCPGFQSTGFWRGVERVLHQIFGTPSGLMVLEGEATLQRSVRSRTRGCVHGAARTSAPATGCDVRASTTWPLTLLALSGARSRLPRSHLPRPPRRPPVASSRRDPGAPMNRRLKANRVSGRENRPSGARTCSSLMENSESGPPFARSTLPSRRAVLEHEDAPGRRCWAAAPRKDLPLRSPPLEAWRCEHPLGVPG